MVPETASRSPQPASKIVRQAPTARTLESLRESDSFGVVRHSESGPRAIDLPNIDASRFPSFDVSAPSKQSKNPAKPSFGLIQLLHLRRILIGLNHRQQISLIVGRNIFAYIPPCPWKNFRSSAKLGGSRRFSSLKSRPFWRISRTNAAYLIQFGCYGQQSCKPLEIGECARVFFRSLRRPANLWPHGLEQIVLPGNGR